MAQQVSVSIEPGSALHELAQSIDMAKVPEKLICKNCMHFLLNAFKTACCEGSLCENCNTTSIGGACPLCKHDPLISNPSKALRGTAKSLLRGLSKTEQTKAAEMAKAVPKDTETLVTQDAANLTVVEVAVTEVAEPQKADQSQSAVDDDVAGNVPSAEVRPFKYELKHDADSCKETTARSRRNTMESATSGNDADDDEIEISVGPDYDLSEMPEPGHGEGDEEWYQEDQHYQEKPRRDSMRPTKQDRNNSFAADNADTNKNNNMPSEAMFPNGMNMSMMNSMWSQFHHLQEIISDPSATVNNPQDFMQMQNQWMATMQMNPMMAANMMQNYPNMQSMFAAMQQNMGMQMPQMPMGMNGNQSWNGNMMPFGNQGFNPMMNNGASFSQGQQYQNFQNGNYRDNTRFRGRGRNKRGRGGFYQQHDQFNNFNNMPFPQQNNFASGSNSINSNSRTQRDQYQQDQYSANDHKEPEHTADDDEFAPGGQDEVQEALGDSYKVTKSLTPEPLALVEQPVDDVKQGEYLDENDKLETPPLMESPRHEPEEAYIPEAYREDLDFAVAPPTAPSGPSAKDVPYRARGHGRYPSRGGRGSFHGSNGYPPQSPARPVSQPQNISPNTNQGTGVIGAPTGPRAMREKDIVPVRTLSHAESDVGFKIRGTANQAKDRVRDDAQQRAGPRAGYDDHDDRSTSRRRSKHEPKFSTSRNHYDQADEQDDDRRRRKSRRDDDYDHDMQDSHDTYARSDSHDREVSKKEVRRNKDKKEKHGSKYKSSRRQDDEQPEYEDDRQDDQNRSSRYKKSSSKHEDEERRDRDHDRAEKDKHRKRSRHDRDREDEDHGWEDEDEAASRRRSRKVKTDTGSSRKDRDRESERDHENTDLGMRINGKASRSREPTAPTQSDKDPHTLEREARNKERMDKEAQRRKNAEKSSTSLSGGRKMNVVYEDQIDSRNGRGHSKYSKRR